MIWVWYWIQTTTAGWLAYIMHWGLGIASIILLVAGAIFSQSIPIIGPYLHEIRKDMLWAAAAIALFLGGQWVGAHDAANRCDKKAVVIEKIVKQVVKGTTTPKAAGQKDKYDSPNN